ncbi:MAG: hypothetical protein ACYTF1_17605 [Planctomycetota bacterium]|jgi:hypothetical protein
MTVLEKPAQKAQRRLWFNRWLVAMGWTLTIAAGLFIVAVIIERVFIAADDSGPILAIIAAALAGAALIAAIIYTIINRENLNQAAAQLDLAAGLKERISTGLHCQSAGDPFSRAVVTDAQNASRAISVPKHLPIRVPNSAGYAGATFVIALLIFWLFPSLDLAGKQSQRQQELERSQRVSRTVAQVKPVIEQQIKKISRKNPLLKKELEDMKPLEEAQFQKPIDVQREAKKQIAKINEKLKNRKNSTELGQINEFKKLMRRLADKQQSPTPVGDLSNALAKGDFKSASKAIEAIKLELSKKPKTPEEKQRQDELKKQLDALSKKINMLANENKKMRDQLAKSGLSEKQIKQLMEKLKNNDLEAVKKMLADNKMSPKQINKMMQQMKSCQGACSGAQMMAQSLAQAGAMGQMSQAGMEGLNSAGEQLSQLEAMQMELNQLNADLAELTSLYNKIGNPCGNCGGKGCGQCMKKGPGMGLKPGQGEGNIAPEEETAINTKIQKAKVYTNRGRIISQQWVDGEQYKGEVSQEFLDANIAAERDVTDAIAREKIPRVYQTPVKEYFKRTSEQPNSNQ